MNRVRQALALVVAVSLLSVAACSNVSKVTGSVAYKGAPVSGATVTLVADDGNVVGTGVTNDAGEFTLVNSQGKDAIPNGTYKAVVMKLETVEGSEPPKLEGGEHTKDIAKMMVGGAFPKGKGPKGMPAAVTAKKKKSLIPETFGSHTSTTLKVTVPSKEAIRLDLGS